MIRLVDKFCRKDKKLAAEKNAQIWFGHDGEQFAEFRKSTDGYYE